MKCPLCGKKFEESESKCGSCPMHSGCGMVRCPNCGYEYVERSKIVDWFRNLFKKKGGSFHAHQGNR